VPTVIKSFRDRFPAIDLRVVESSAAGILEELAAHRLDLAVVTNAESSPQIVVEPLLTEELYAIVPVDDPLAQREEIDLHELRERPFIVLESGFSLRAVIWEACRAAGFAPLIAQEMSSIQGIKGLVEIGMGVSIAPRMAIDQEERLGLLKAIRLRQRPHRELEIVTSKGAYVSRSAAEFIAICRRVAATMRAEP
jgi:LysR family transcriptional activator of glutamate synthase operon